MIRRFLYMIDLCHSGASLSHRLRRFNPSRLFYPKADALPRASPAAAAAAVEDARLPPTAMVFSASMGFMRRNDDKIVSIEDTGRRANLYDPAAHTVRALPAMISPKFLTVSLPVGDDLYVMETTPWPDKDGGSEGRPVHSFEALTIRSERDEWGLRETDDCYWRPLPPPPFVHHAAGHQGRSGEICGYAAAGDSHILVSTNSYGTYVFDTASAAWSKAGDWALPFRGRAEHVPEHGLWFGFSDMDDSILGAWNLSSSTLPEQQQQPPVASLQSKGFSVARQLGLSVFASHVFHLGDGKLCVAKLFKIARRGTCVYPCCVSERDERNFAMLTGVEVVRGGRGGKLRIVKHKSCRYSFGQYHPVTVL